MTFAVIARYVTREQDAGDVRDALLAMRAHTLQEPANVAYVVHEDSDTPATFILYEQYVDRAGFDAHVASAHFAQYIVGRVRPLLTDRQVQFGTVI